MEHRMPNDGNRKHRVRAGPRQKGRVSWLVILGYVVASILATAVGTLSSYSLRKLGF
jgi:hypothetical protein